MSIINRLFPQQTKRRLALRLCKQFLLDCLSLIKNNDKQYTNNTIEKIDFYSTECVFVSKRDNLPNISPLVKAIAFYLPQFHPFPENNEWWGQGFTEWTNVGKAKPIFKNHYQPQCPIHVGYYDLRVKEVMEEQAKLAKEYGIYGFNYYFYWFAGTVLMEQPLEQMLKNKKVDIPFCLTWANENWSRRWDGQENDILIAQEHSDEDSLNFIRYIEKYFKDERYIAIDNKPILIIYRANIIPNIKSIAHLWRAEAKTMGFPDLYLISAQSFGITDPSEFGFDASMEFPPHTSESQSYNNNVEIINPDFDGQIYNYQEVVKNAVKKDFRNVSYKCFRTAMLSWDNTARKQNSSHIFANFSLLSYKQWLSSLVNSAYYDNKYSKDEKLVFINAWNEWAEGTHLEPDNKYGFGYLQSTYGVLKNYDEKYTFLKNKPMGQGKAIAIILHVHYEEIWHEISIMLQKLYIEQSFDLYVTVTSSNFSNPILKDFPKAYIQLVDNRGRDILPFITILKLINNMKFNYEAICKIHTKKSVYREDGDSIRTNMLDSLLNASLHARERYTQNPKLGLLIPQNNSIPHTDKNMTYAHENIRLLEEKLNIPFIKGSFPAGSMFWFRPDAVKQLLKLNSSDFDVEEGLVDGTLAHAVERYFCILANSNHLTSEVIIAQ